MIRDASSGAKPGDWVHVYDKTGAPAGNGLWNPRSRVPLRMLHSGEQFVEETFLTELLDRAIRHRIDFLQLPKVTDAFRVVHSDADGLSGLIVDKFADVLSIQVHSLGMFQRIGPWIVRMHELLGTKRVVFEIDDSVSKNEGISSNLAKTDPVRMVKITEHGVRYEVDFAEGHKTGFFCDQRDNRHRLAQLCEGKSVLDLCCYTGGFSVQAAKAGNASEVTGVDLDAEPLATAKKNADINQTRVRFVQSDAFAFMRDMLRIGRQYDVVVLDPPKLIRSRLELEEGSHKHFDLNRLAIQLVKPGGILLTCSCAGLLDDESFHGIVRSAAKATGFDDSGSPLPPRTLQILHSHGAAPDHPVVAHCPETGYLKSIWARVL